MSKHKFSSDQDVRWCPGCGDYAVLATLQRTLTTLDLDPKDQVFISGIGCASRLPYYMNTYGFHTIHGRAPAIATGLKLARPELNVWVITGDGDGLSIGIGHLLHAMRRNVNIKIILINNRIYGLTKGQYSPTSEHGKINKASPTGVVDWPISPINIALAAECSMVGRAIDVDSKTLGSLITQAATHNGTSFIEVLQNCNVFNDGAFSAISGREERTKNCIFLNPGENILSNGMVFDPTQEKSIYLAHELARQEYPELVAMGLLRKVERECYDNVVRSRIKSNPTKQQLTDLLHSGSVWEV